MSNITRITGMASGLDVDSLVQKMMKAESVRLDTMKQDRQTTQWKQDSYRDILGDLSTFKSTYFDILKSDKYMLNPNTYTSFDVNSDTPSAATATASGNATTGAYTLSDILVATAAKSKGSKITLNTTISGVPSTRPVVNSDLMSVAISNDTDNPASGIVKFSIINGKNTDGTDNLVNFSYDFTNADKGSTIDSIMKDISSKSGLKVSCSELGSLFSISSKDTGLATNFKINWDDSDTSSDTHKLMGLFGITGDGTSTATNTIHGTDASVTITDPNGIKNTVTNAKNSFSIDGINYNLLQNTTSTTQTVNINVTANAKNVIDKIKDYISKYNDIVDKIQTTITEKKDRNYPPLTDDQKKSMSADDIKTWETKAKVGLLKGDSELQGLLSGMRNALFSSAKGAGVSLSDLGLDTSSDVLSGGKIVIKDETKLNNYILNNGDKVAELFTKTSTTVPDYSKTLTVGQKQTRLSEEGIFQSVYDTLQDYTSTIGGKGLLLQKAGIKGDFTEYTNTLTDDLNDKDKAIAAMVKKLSAKEDSYYLKFSKLETAMQSLNSQQSWLTQQLSGN